MSKVVIPSTILEKITSSVIRVAGTNVKLIPSNIRVNGFNWSNVELVNGVGKEGNLVLVEAITETGSVSTLENSYGTYQKIHKGDKFVFVLANRHSGTSESGGIPSSGMHIKKGTELHLMSRAGIVGRITDIPKWKIQKPYKFKAYGLLSKKGKLLDLIEMTGGHHKKLNVSAPIVLVFGTSAEVGKTTTTVGMIRAFIAEGKKTAAIKVSGSGGLVEELNYRDAGAFPWLDFQDVGLPTTYTSPERFTGALYTTVNYTNTTKPDIIVAETGGDPIESNIPTMLADKQFMQYVKAFIIVSSDVMGMMGIVSYLNKNTLSKPMYFAYPKDRNTVTTDVRVKSVLPGTKMFNSLDLKDTRKIARMILKIK